MWVEKMKSTWDPTKGLVEMANLRMDLLDEISTKMVPETVLSTFMTRSMASLEDLWLMRKQFTLQTAVTMFVTYVFFISARTPGRRPAAAVRVTWASNAVQSMAPLSSKGSRIADMPVMRLRGRRRSKGATRSTSP